MSFITEDYHFNDLKTRDNNLFTNIEEDIQIYIENIIADHHQKLKEKSLFCDFHFSISTSKSKHGYYQSSGQFDSNIEYLQQYIDKRDDIIIFESKMKRIYSYLSDNIDKISTLIEKPINIDFSFLNSDLDEKYKDYPVDNKVITKMLYPELKKILTSSFLQIFSEYGDETIITFDNGSLKVLLPENKNEIKESYSFFLLQNFSKICDFGFNNSVKEFSLATIKKINLKDNLFFEKSFHEANALYQKKNILNEISSGQTTSSTPIKKRI